MRLSAAMVSLAALAALAASQGANAAMVWDESINGDLSNDGLAPQALTLFPGSNQLVGSTGDGGQGVDRDYFTFTLTPGRTLSSIRLLGNTFVSGAFSFIGIQTGPQVTVQPSGAGGNLLLGWTHYSMNDIGTDILPAITSGGPLSPGTYSVWVQDTGGPATYGFDLGVTGVTPVPLPPSVLLMASTLLGLGGIFRRRVSTG